ncbi:MAG: glycine cleavage system protein GcvH [Ponticaulis sp.]|nr:glycine cleavage system protein GcvH [Ponticaulis sp.]MDF1680999.1 glycine cleavage system protein GcvH [Ponticaulis sp.]
MTVKYTEDHEWVSMEGDTATVGITAYAAEQLGDVVFVELPEEGRNSNKGDELAVVESVKAASDVYAPVSGIVKEANSELEGAPETVNQDPEGKGWFVKMLITDPTQLDAMMDAEAYKAFCADL